MIGDDTGDNVIPLPGVRLAPPAVPPASGDGPGAPFEETEGISLVEAGPPDSAIMASAIEAILFTAGDPIPLPRLRTFLADPDEDQLRAALVQLQARYERGGHGIRLVEVGGGWQIRTHPRFATWVVRSRGMRAARLSKAALETLAVVAYKQPVTRAEIEDVRGVDAGGVLRTLLERGLVRTLGHREEPGRPLEYGTTPRFLEIFGLRDLSDLPTLRDLRELKDDDPREGVGVGDGDAFEEGEAEPWDDDDAPSHDITWLPRPDDEP